MTNAPQPPTDAEKLVSVCRAVWPADGWAADEDGSIYPLKAFKKKFPMNPGCLDDLARILRGLTPGQRGKFDEIVDDLRYEAAMLEEGYAWCLTAPLPVLLDALFRAVCEQQK